MLSQLKIGIVGGSLAGCSAAILLARAGHDISVFERSTGRMQGRGGGIGTPRGTFSELLEQNIIDRDFPHTNAKSMPFIGRRSADDVFGHTAMELPIDLACFHWGTLWDNLRKRVPDESYHNGTQVIAASQVGNGVTLELGDGSNRRFDIVLFADGYRSLGRRILFPDSELSYRGFALWRGLLPETAMKDFRRLDQSMPRLSYADLPGHLVIYSVPGFDGTVAEGGRICNWAAYIPISPNDLPAFLTDGNGKKHEGSLPPGAMRAEEEERLKSLMENNLPPYYAGILRASRHTYVQAIYTMDLPAYALGCIGLIGDAGILTQPFTGSGIFKGFENAKDLVTALQDHDTAEGALSAWSETQTERGKGILALGRQMEDAFIWKPLDFARAEAEETRAWWKASIKFPERFTYEGDE